MLSSGAVWEKGRAILRTFRREEGGNFAIMTAVLLPILAVATGGVIEVTSALHERHAIQAALDSGVLTAANHAIPAERQSTVEKFMTANYFKVGGSASVTLEKLTVSQEADGHLTALFKGTFSDSYLRKLGLPAINLTVKSTALAGTQSGGAPCLMVLANQAQAMLQNSESKLDGDACEVDVKSAQNPAYIINSKAEIKVGKFCIEGTKITNNGGKIDSHKLNCRTPGDPYMGNLPVPNVSSVCKTSGAQQSAKEIVVEPGVHCNTTFNGSPRITFAPGLHIIKGTMIINSGARIDGTGVTFFYADLNSYIQFNGTVKLEVAAPTSGIYEGLLMYENPVYTANKSSLVFNSMDGESLEGIVYLPNRNVTYNSKSNCSNKVSMVVNTLIINLADWRMEPYANKYAGSGSSAGARLTH